MPPNKSKIIKQKKWGLVGKNVNVSEARKTGITKILKRGNSGIKYFDSFDAAEKYRKEKRLSVKSIPIKFEFHPPGLSKSKPKPKSLSKLKWKINKDKISDLKFDIKRLEKHRDEKVAEYSAKLKATDEFDHSRRKELRKGQAKTRRLYGNDIDNVNNKIIREKLHYSKIRALVKKTFPAQKSESHSTAIRGYRSYSPGYDIEIPTVYNPQINISWNAGMFMSGEREKAVNKKFKDELIPVLKEYGVKFKEHLGYIVIEEEK